MLRLGDQTIMHPSRTPVDWLIVIINIPALLLGLAVGWMWIWEAAQHYQAEDDHPNIRIGMCIGFMMSYLVWLTVVVTYVILKRTSSPSAAPVASAQPLAQPVPIARTVPIDATKVAL